MIHITWHFALLIVTIIIGFIWAITRDNYNRGYLGFSSRHAAIALYVICTIIIVLIYGGIYWW